MTKNGIIINGKTYGLVDDTDKIYRCDHCALLDKCVEFWGMLEEGSLNFCRFLFGDDAKDKRFEETTN